MFQSREPVTICDQFDCFFLRQPEKEVFREPVDISFYLLIYTLGWLLPPNEGSALHNLT